jgi:hypothetical protein
MSDMSYLDDGIRSQATFYKKAAMPKEYEPDSWTVICGRGKDFFNHSEYFSQRTERCRPQKVFSRSPCYHIIMSPTVGNKRFRVLCESQAEKYRAMTSKVGKSMIVSSIVDAVREGSGTSGFVKQVRLRGRPPPMVAQALCISSHLFLSRIHAQPSGMKSGTRQQEKRWGSNFEIA